KQHGGGDGTSEGGEIRANVVHRGNESLVHDMGDSYEDTARERHGQEEAHHGRSLPEAPQPQLPERIALRSAHALQASESHCRRERSRQMSWARSSVSRTAPPMNVERRRRRNGAPSRYSP